MEDEQGGLLRLVPPRVLQTLFCERLLREEKVM